MAKTTRRPRTEHDTTPADDMRNPSLPAAVTNSDIARRAYELCEQRGGEHGRDWDDWLLAENELRDAATSPAA
jgi:hypothetical protein